MPEARPAWPLQRRLAVTLVGLTVATAALLGAAYWAAERWVESRSLQDLLERELLRRAGAGPVDGQDEGLLYYRAGAGRPPPPPLDALQPGWYRRLGVHGHPYAVLVRELAAGDRAYLLYDDAALDTRERRLLAWLAAALVASAAAAWQASRWLAARLLAPLGQLVGAIGALDPERGGVRLELPAPVELAELRVIVQALDRYMQRLEALLERERLFAAAASHELRSPLAVIGGAAEVLQELGPAPAPVQRITRAVRQAQQDLAALLALSRRAPEAAESLALAELLPQWAQDELAGWAGAPPQLRWQLQAGSVQAPPGSLHIIFCNLLRNALRAAGGSGCVIISAGAERLCISDSGPGIAAAELPHLFEPHARGSGGGSGIGLYIAMVLAQRQGWQLSLRNGEAGGASAELRLTGTGARP